MIAYRVTDRAIFLLGFAKSERDNVAADELKALRELAVVWLHASDQQIEMAIEEGVLKEVYDGDEEEGS